MDKSWTLLRAKKPVECHGCGERIPPKGFAVRTNLAKRPGRKVVVAARLVKGGDSGTFRVLTVPAVRHTITVYYHFMPCFTDQMTAKQLADLGTQVAARARAKAGQRCPLCCRGVVRLNKTADHLECSFCFCHFHAASGGLFRLGRHGEAILPPKGGRVEHYRRVRIAPAA